MNEDLEFLHFHFCNGIAGAAKGFNEARDSYRGINARFRCIGGVDVDPDAVRFFGREAGVQGTLLDLFDREQYTAFHGHPPPPGWREATIADIHLAAHYERPHVVFISAPCKGFSGLLAQSKSMTPKYQALNRLTLRCVWLMCEAWGDDPPEFIAFENVPRIGTRGSGLIEQIRTMLARYGYAVVTPNNYVHDCGELGGLAQSRRRFFLMARHMGKVPPFLYQPEKRPLRAVGEILGAMPMPNDPRGGPMHTMPNLQWKTWVRLAFVEAGGDWRSLNKLRVVDGKLADYLLVPSGRNDLYGVNAWGKPTGTITGDARPMKGAFAVADPRSPEYSPGYLGVSEWTKPSHTVSGRSTPSNGHFSIADPRFQGHEYGQYGVRAWGAPMGAVAAGTMPGQGGYAVADPRHTGPSKFNHCYRVVRFDDHAQAISSGGGKEQCVADPRINLQREKGDNYLTAGHYGVVPWADPCGAVSAAASADNGRWSVADPRLPEPADKGNFIIVSPDNTWHRPFTTLELAALQSFITPEQCWGPEPWNLDGISDSKKREFIGNAVPPESARAIASAVARALLMARSGETFALSAMPIWVQPFALALAIDIPEGQ